MRIKAQKVRDGLHPSEVVVSVATVNGTEKLVVDNGAFSNDSLDIGYPIEDAGDKYLVELPHETESGSWRVWVPEHALS